jgi:GNAT superfamily N-acetyltransferase
MDEPALRIRGATGEDWPEVARLLAELGRPEVLGSDLEDRHREAFQSYLDRPEVMALVAVRGNETVGFLDMEYRQRLNFLRPQAWVPDLVVVHRERSRGVGGALLARAEELAREYGCWGMSLESATWRTRAHDFYVRQGWAETGRSFTRNLTGEPWPPAPRP